LTRSKEKAPIDPLLQCSGDNVGDQGRADYRRSLWNHAKLLLALFAAAATALLLGLFAHDAMGMSIDVIRIDALGGATLIFAVVAGGSMLGRKR
jgi:hypothetical protein